MTPMRDITDLDDIERVLAEQRFETARRMCLARLPNAVEGVRVPLLKLLHVAYRRLGDLDACRRTLERIQPGSIEEQIETLVLLGEDYRLLASDGAYRQSAEARAGLTVDEYRQKMERLASECLEQAKALAKTPSAQTALSLAIQPETESQNRVSLPSREGKSLRARITPAVAEPRGTVAGTLRFPNGHPVCGATVTLGLRVEFPGPEPSALTTLGVGYQPRAAPPEAMQTWTDSAGRFRIDNVPPDNHAFLAVTLEPDRFDIATRFLMHGVVVQPGRETICDLVVKEWISSPPEKGTSPFPGKLNRNGVRYHRLTEWKFSNPFPYDFPRQVVALPLPKELSANPKPRCLFYSDAPMTPLTFQHAGDELLCMVGLPSQTTRVLALYESEEGQPADDEFPGDFFPQPESDEKTAILDTGRAAFRIPWGTGADSQAPLLAVRGEDGLWRGQGRMILPEGIHVLRRQTRVLATGAVCLQLEVKYDLSNGTCYALHLTAYRDEPYLLMREICPNLEGGGFEFSLREFIGGRGFLHWTTEGGQVHWTDLRAEDRELARLQESVPWWIYPAGFAYAMTPDGLDQQDYIGIFTVERGRWVDPLFSRLSQGPGDRPEERELDWPYPEMVGSPISMITANTYAAGDAVFRFRFFDGERRWGILVSTLDRNDGPFKEISAVQHKNSSPRLEEFRGWNLDLQDTEARPFLVCRRDNLRNLRQKKPRNFLRRSGKRSAKAM